MVFEPELLSVLHAAIAQCNRLSGLERRCGAEVLPILR